MDQVAVLACKLHFGTPYYSQATQAFVLKVAHFLIQVNLGQGS